MSKEVLTVTDDSDIETASENMIDKVNEVVTKKPSHNNESGSDPDKPVSQLSSL